MVWILNAHRAICVKNEDPFVSLIKDLLSPSTEDGLDSYSSLATYVKEEDLIPMFLLLDQLLHHTETVIIEGKSYRMKKVIEN